MSLKKNFHGRRVEGGAAVADEEFVQKQQASGGDPNVSFTYNELINAIKILWQTDQVALEVLGIVRNGTINIEAIDALLHLKGGGLYEATVDEYGFSFFAGLVRLLSMDDERLKTAVDLHFGQQSIVFFKTENDWTDAVRLSPLGRIEKYSNGYWLPIGTDASLTNRLADWNAATNTPAHTSGVGTTGDWFIVDVAGTTTLDSITSWDIGDYGWFDGTAWQKIDNSSAQIGAAGVSGSLQVNVNGALASRDGLVVDLEKNILKYTRFGLYATSLLTQLRDGTLEYDGADLHFTFADFVRRKIPIRLTANKMFFGGALGEVTEIGTTDIYGASTATKTFLDTEANWYDGSGYPKSSVFPGAGEVGQRHRNTNYIYECVALGEWVRYILPNGYVDVWGLPLSEKVKLENAANWTGKVYTGTALSGCLAGYKHFTNDYVYEFVALNTPIRYART